MAEDNSGAAEDEADWEPRYPSRPPDSGPRLGLEARFERALEEIWIAYQPIVAPDEGVVFGYEALLRSKEPSLATPKALLCAAERLGRIHELGRAVRRRALAALREESRSFVLFLNLHPIELLDRQLYSELMQEPQLSRRIVLEVTERAPLTEIDDVPGRIAALRKAGVRVALDDLGAGYSGLSSFVELEPDMVKLDMSLIRNADKHPVKQRLIQLLAHLCQEMTVTIVAEGIETEEEREVATAMGCNLLQGFRFGRPEGGFGKVLW